MNRPAEPSGANNLRQLVLACNSFASDRGGSPPSANWSQTPVRGDRTIGIYSLQCYILPYVGQADLYNSINFKLTWARSFGSSNTTIRRRPRSSAPFFARAAATTTSRPFATNSYRACAGLGEARRSW